MRPVCPHGGRMWDTEKPFCDDRGCHRAWWMRYGVPVLLLLASVIAVGLVTQVELGNIGEHGYTGWSAT